MGPALRVLLAHDDGPAAGLGHRRRMEALAAALRDAGHATSFCRMELGAMRQVPYDKSVVDVVVVDSYAVRADDTSAVDAGVVVAVDDLQRDLAVDVVVDPSPGADAAVHERARHVLAGASYALVDLAVVALQPAPIVADVRRVFVAFGGHDRDRYGDAVAASIASGLGGDAEVELAAGPWRDAEELTAGVSLVRTTDGLAPHLARADVVVTAGGVTLLESLALGRPTVAVAISDNQRVAVHGVGAAGAAVEATVDDAATQAIALAGDHEQRVRLAGAATTLVDGRGASRVATAIVDAATRAHR